MATFSQRTFSGGEIAPALHSRVDTQKYLTGLKTCRNFITMKHGGVASRPGTKYVGRLQGYTADTKYRLIPWNYASDDQYILVLCQGFFNVIKNGNFVIGNTGRVTNVSAAGVVTVAMSYNFNYINNDIVTISKIEGTCTDLENLELMVHAVDSSAKTFRLHQIHEVSAISSLTKSGTVMTLVTTQDIWKVSDVGRTITTTGLPTVANNGTFTITNYDAPNQIRYTNAGGATVTTMPSTGQVFINYVPTGTIVNTAYASTKQPIIKKRYRRTIPYQGADLALIRYVQSRNVMTLVHGDYPIIEITRRGDANWDVEAFVAGTERKITRVPRVYFDCSEVWKDGVTPITDINDLPDNAEWIGWAVSVVDGEGRESLPRYSYFAKQPGTTTIDPTYGSAFLHNNNVAGDKLRGQGTTTITTPLWEADSVYVSPSSPTTGSARKIIIMPSGSSPTAIDYRDKFSVVGILYDDKPFTEVLNGSTVSYDSTRASKWGQLETVNYFKRVDYITSASAIAGTSSATARVKAQRAASDYENVKLTWSNHEDNTGNGPYSYRVYRSNGGAYGLIGETTVPFFHDIGIEADYTQRPLSSRNPFEKATELKKADFDRSPRCVGFFQQRRLFGNQDAHPERIHVSSIGHPELFDYRTKLKESDAFFFELSGNKPQRIQHFMSLAKLVVFTSDGEWVLNGDDAGSLTPTAINAVQHSHYGTGYVAPVAVGQDCIFVQPKGNVLRTLGWRQQANGYSGDDLTIFAYHLFRNYATLDLTYQQGPDSIIWCTRDDGKLLGMTYLPEQNIVAWHRHDMRDFVITSVESVEEYFESIRRDSVYMVVEEEDFNSAGHKKSYVVRLDQPYYTAWDNYNCSEAYVVQNGWNFDEEFTLKITTGTTYAAGQTLTINAYYSGSQASDDSWAFPKRDLEPNGSWIGKKIHFGTIGEDPSLIVTITGWTDENTVTGTATAAVPAALQNTDTSEWGIARNEVSNRLWHMAGKEVSVRGDGDTVYSPATSSATVSATGTVTLPDYYVRVVVGAPICHDMVTLDIDTADGETLADKKLLVPSVTVHVERSRGGLIGANMPTTDFDLTELYSMTMDTYPGQDDGYGPVTGKREQIISPDWQSNGRVAIRHVEPQPLEILAVHPAVTGSTRRSPR
jgi:hypothetical protein